MSNLSRRGLAALAVVFAITGIASLPAQAQQKPVIKVSSLTLPVFNPLVWNIMKVKGIDAKHGFELDAHAYPSISAFYAGFATGETDVLIGGPTILQKLYQEGVPVRIIATGFTLADLVIFTKNDAIKSLADLKGKQLAVDMGGSQFQVTKMYLAAKGIDLGKDITVVNANFAVARAQLEADRVDAALVIEPLASIIAKQNPTGRSSSTAQPAGRKSPAPTAGKSSPRCAQMLSRKIQTRRRCWLRRSRTSQHSCPRTPRKPTRSPTRR